MINTLTNLQQMERRRFSVRGGESHACGGGGKLSIAPAADDDDAEVADAVAVAVAAEEEAGGEGAGARVWPPDGGAAARAWARASAAAIEAGEEKMHEAVADMAAALDPTSALDTGPEQVAALA